MIWVHYAKIDAPIEAEIFEDALKFLSDKDDW
jgi:hypothetical protein